MPPNAQMGTYLLEAVQKSRLPALQAVKAPLQIDAIVSRWYTSALVLTSDCKAFAILSVCNTEEEVKREAFSSFWCSAWELVKSCGFREHSASVLTVWLLWLVWGASCWAPPSQPPTSGKPWSELELGQAGCTAAAQAIDFHLFCF